MICKRRRQPTTDLPKDLISYITQRFHYMPDTGQVGRRWGPFARLVWTSRGKFFFQFSSKSFATLWKPVAFRLKTWTKPSDTCKIGVFSRNFTYPCHWASERQIPPARLTMHLPWAIGQDFLCVHMFKELSDRILSSFDPWKNYFSTEGKLKLYFIKIAKHQRDNNKP